MAECQFFNYIDAQEEMKLKFPINNELNGDEITGLESIKLITDTDSYNYEMFDFKRIYVTGCGYKLSPGHPSTHQNPFRQTMINIANVKRNRIHVFHETGTNAIVFRGLYKIHEITRQITHAGWVYYQMELRRCEIMNH